MESLDNSEWDVVICGTGLPQSLLALALSRSGKKILHIDANNYYGGDEAALSLSEAETWAQKHSEKSPTTFSSAAVTKPDEGQTAGSALLSSRAYSLALAPQLIYSRSSLIDALVSSHTHAHLEFQAVGSWFIVNAPPAQSASQARLSRVPGGREDVFQDDGLDLKQKRALMKFLRFVVKYEEEPDIWQDCPSGTFPAFLQDRFNLPPSSHAPILALTMSDSPPADTSIEAALAGIARHLRSIGYFGAGFGAVLPKWGGLAEICQVACRACAVGGGVYVLDQGIAEASKPSGRNIEITLSNGNNVKTKWLTGCTNTLPRLGIEELLQDDRGISISRSVSIVSSPLSSLFPQTAEGGVTPAGAVCVLPAMLSNEPSVYIIVHSSESGECPSNQCVLYASVAEPGADGVARLETSVRHLLQSLGEATTAEVLWSVSFQHKMSSQETFEQANAENGTQVLTLPSLSQTLVLEDWTLTAIKDAWQKITERDADSFMKFEVREGLVEDDDA